MALATVLVIGLGGACARSAHADASTAAPAANPFEAGQAELLRQVLREGKKPRAMLPLLELWRRWDMVSPSTTTQALARVARDARLSPPVRAYAARLHAQGLARQGELEASSQAFAALGYVTRWRVVGPFDNEGKQGFDQHLPPGSAPLASTDLEASYAGRDRAVRWREHPRVSRFGYVSFDTVFRPRENVCGLAETYVRLPRTRVLSLWTGAGGAVEVEWNGRQVLRDARYRRPDPDRHAASVRGRPGLNRLRVKVCVTDQPWGFYLRIADPRGAPLPDVEVTAEPTAIGTDEVPSAALPRAPRTPLAALEARVEKSPDDPQALEDLARFLARTHADDTAARRAKQLAARAAKSAPTLDRILLAAELAEQRAAKLAFLQLARTHFPDAPRTHLLDARLRASGPEPEQALASLRRIAPDDEPGVHAADLEARLLGEIDLPEHALATFRRKTAALADTPFAARRLARLANRAGDADLSIQQHEAHLAGRFDSTGTRQALISDALARGDDASVLRHLDTLEQLGHGSSERARYMAEVYQALGRDDLALETYREAMAIAPEDAQTHVAYAQALLRGHQPELAAEALREALRYKPQHAFARELLEQLSPAPRDDETQAVDSETLLARRDNEAGYSSHVLQDLTVTTVYENGLGSRFRQLAVQVHDDAGARRWRSHSIQFDPVTQRVQLRLARIYRPDGSRLESVRTFERQLGEPWYRIYYDTRAKVVVLPDLEPGDVIELRWRVDDIAHRNLFADYFGDVQMLQREVPTTHLEYVLSTPRSRQFHFHVPQMSGLTRTEQVAQDRRIHRFVAEQVPALHTEAGMPGHAEVSPYLHVSTYRSWKDVGRWYWGLIEDQLHLDDSLERTVERLVADAPSTEQKVERIYDWVLRHTRYVGLEFGIHGYLPYRVSQVAQRGFGDCKDKASLLYAMLEHAGVDARIVLLRTRRNGDIDTEPASLAVFDHAIAYVPELDLYLDGTAEHSGTKELPGQDQGVMVLQVGPDASQVQLARTPMLAPDANARDRALAVHLSADGSARVEGEEQVRGAEAAYYREHYQAPGTRTERLERSLAKTYPGARLQDQAFESLQDREAPVRYRYVVEVPGLAQVDGDRLRAEPASLGDLVRAWAQLPRRQHPLDMGTRRSYRESRTWHLAAGLEPAELPAGGEASSRFGRLAVRFEKEGRHIVSHTELELMRSRISAADYPAFRRWVQQADMLLRQRLVFRKVAR